MRSFSAKLIVSRPILFPILSGMSFALIGVAYGFGKKAGIRPIEIMLICTGAGSLVFAGKRLRGRPTAPIPMRIWWWGVAGGLSQYLALLGIGRAMQLGPLSPVVCAGMLSFIPVIFYSVIRYQERLNLLKVCATAAGVGCIIVSAFTNSRDGMALTSLAGTLGYAAVLLVILALNSICNIAVKTLGMGTQPSQSNNSFLLVMYATFFVVALADLLWQPSPNLSLEPLVLLGLLAAGGSICGFSLLTICAGAPASLVFTLNGISAIITAALISVLFLGEHIGVGWCATIGLGILSIVFGVVPDDSRASLQA